jgi:hypothetical protein
VRLLGFTSPVQVRKEMVVSGEAIRCIEESKEVHLAPNGKEYFGIGLGAVRSIAQDKGMSVKEVGGLGG